MTVHAAYAYILRIIILDTMIKHCMTNIYFSDVTLISQSPFASKDNYYNISRQFYSISTGDNYIIMSLKRNKLFHCDTVYMCRGEHNMPA